MAQGIIQVSSNAFKDYFDLTIDPALIDLGKLKEAFLLPERYQVDQVRRAAYWHIYDIEVVVSSPDIPEVPDGKALPTITPYFFAESNDDFRTRTTSLSDILIDGVSAIREEDKGRKVTIEIKEVIDAHADARNTQFQGFAKLLWEELFRLNVIGARTYAGYAKKAERVIAQRAYDLAHHVVENVSAYNMLSIPDLTELPKDKSP